MNTQHTPGPWSIAQTFHDEGEPYAILGNERQVQGLSARKGSTMATDVARVYSEEDARLIAAAPALLAACEGLLAAIEEHGEDCPEIQERLAHCPGAEITRAAIAQARGEKGE